MANVHQENLLSKVSTVMDTPNHSDLTIKCRDQKFKVHKLIVCTISSVIAAACEQKMKENETGIIEHTEYDADTVQRMISYMYKQTYTVDGYALPRTLRVNADPEVDAYEELIPQNVNGKLMAHVRVYTIGEYYDIPTLKVLANDYFAAAAKEDFQIDGFIHVIKEVNRLTSPDDRMLRDTLRDHAKEHIRELTRDDGFMVDLAEVEDVQDFAADMLRQMVRHQILDNKAFEQQLEMKDQEVAVANRNTERVKEELDEARREMQHEIRVQEEAIEHVEGVMDRLADSIAELPSECGSSRCDRAFGALTVERKGHPQRGAGQGDWLIRCQRCKCRLNK